MFEKHKKRIHQKIKNKMTRVSNHIVRELISNSPVWTGEYVKSMEVSQAAVMHTRLSKPSGKPYPPKIVGAEALKASEKIKLKTTAKLLIETGNKKIVFGNAAPHANFVEYLGWEMEGFKPPNAVFAKTAASTELRKKSL